MHVHYHEPLLTEPVQITDDRFQSAFSWVKNLTKISESQSKTGYTLASDSEKYVLWSNFQCNYSALTAPRQKTGMVRGVTYSKFLFTLEKDIFLFRRDSSQNSGGMRCIFSFYKHAVRMTALRELVVPDPVFNAELLFFSWYFLD